MQRNVFQEDNVYIYIEREPQFVRSRVYTGIECSDYEGRSTTSALRDLLRLSR